MQIIWWILGIIGGLVALFFALLTAGALSASPKREYDTNSPFHRFLIDMVAFLSVYVSRIRLHVTGEENLPRDGRFLLVGNHRSNYDPFVTEHALRKWDLAFLSKPENFNVIFIGRIIRRCCFLPIDRENPRNALKTIEKATRLLRRGDVSVAVYPEGTRSKSGELLPFHNSVFKMAQWAQVPIVIAVIRGTEQVKRRYPWRATDVTLEILPPLTLEELRGKRSQEIGEVVREKMLEHLQ